MNKKLIAVAVAGMFAAPAAFAQTTVTITGKAIASFGNYKVSGRPAGATGSNSETQVRDESSTLIFSMREDLGGGLAAIAKYDLRPSMDTGALAATGEDYIGLTSPTMGTIAMGRFPIHYGNHASFTGVHSGLLSNPTAIFDRAGAGATSIARQSRMDNVVRYGSPKFADMFEVVVAYSTSGAGLGPLESEGDLRSTARKGSAWNIQPKLWGKNWEASYSYYTAKPDFAVPVATFSASTGAATTAAANLAAAVVSKHRGDSLYGWYMWGGLRVGLAWNRSKVDNTTLATGATVEASKRTAWGLPISYNWGNHTIYGDFFRARADKAAAFAGLDTKANLFGVTYAYDMSKRTSVGVSYVRIKNGAAAAYNLFTGNAGLVAGEDPRTWNVVMAHRF